MVVVETQQIPSSGAPTSDCPYHVFLSFRGADTRYTFTDHLYKALEGTGLRTFRDDDEIDKGKKIDSELKKAISESQSSIIVFSKNYASSRWCLDELVMIMNRARTYGSKYVVLPVFYHVDPAHVRHQIGSYGEAFAKHESKFKDSEDWTERISSWRGALREAADLSGMDLKSQFEGYEAKFIGKIVAVIQDKVKYKTVSLPPQLTGIDKKVHKINCWIRDESKDVSFMAICGMGGIGKTTIARHAFNYNYNSFDGSSFLSNVRETFEKPDGLIHLQRQLISDISDHKKTEVHNTDEGTNKIKDVLRGKKVLLVLDDVDKEDQLQGVLGLRDFFCEGSKIMITTRNRHLRKAHDPSNYQIHNVRAMNYLESILLFSRHAFGKDEPNEGFDEISKRMIQQCEGLPLALRVLGSSLLGKHTSVWEATLDKLQAVPNSMILQKLKVSYDALQDNCDRELFLEISCFFVGEDKDHMITILNPLDFHARVGVENLMDRSLLEVDMFNKLVMHQMIRDMGREICRLEEPNDPGKRRRLWRHRDSFNVLDEKTGTESIEGIVLDMRQQNGYNALNVNNVKRQKIEHGFNFLAWPQLNGEEYLKTIAFRTMRKLRVLHINYLNGLKGSYKEFPKKIRWLRWDGCPLTYIANDFPLEASVAIEIRHSGLTLGLAGKKVFRFLKILDLSYNKSLREILDFSRFPNLERLILKECETLTEVDESIGSLKNSLIFLDLRNCTSLRKLPRNIVTLYILEVLIISGCTSLEEFPENMEQMKALKIFEAGGISMDQENSSPSRSIKFSDDTSWQAIKKFYLAIKQRGWLLWKPRRNPLLSWASLPSSLVSLKLRNCGLSDNCFPTNFGNIPSLVYLDLDDNPISFLPECIKGLIGLKRINFNKCKSLKSLLGLPEISKHLNVRDCVSLKQVTYQAGAGLKTRPSVIGCSELVSLEHKYKLLPIKSIGRYLLDAFSFIDWEAVEGTYITINNDLTQKTRKGPVQVLEEGCGIMSIFLPGSQVPASASTWFSHRTNMDPHFEDDDPVLLLIVPNTCPPHDATTSCSSNMYTLFLCVVYKYTVMATERQHDYPGMIHLAVENVSKGVKLAFIPTWFVYTEEESNDGEEDMTWVVSNWILGDDKLQPGDLLKIFIEGGLLGHSNVKVKEIGCHIRATDTSQKVLTQITVPQATYMQGPVSIFIYGNY